MIEGKSILAIIPARDGSKRLPGKNIKILGDKPLIAWTIIAAQGSSYIDRIIVSTDSKKIASISKRCGAEIPFRRPKFISDDYTSGASVITHSVKFLIKEGYQFDYVCCVYPPNPFLEISDLKKGFKKIKSKKFNYVFSATLYRFPFFRSFTFSRSKGIKVLFKNKINHRSQDLKQIICDAAHFYWGRKEAWLQEKKLFAKGSDIIMIPECRYHDIDTLENWKLAEKFSKHIF